MKVFEEKKALTLYISSLKASGKRIGFVPTMGALHDGHLSLIRVAKNENDVVVASIFVNPTQFNNPEDLKNYPRTLEPDKEKLLQVNTDILFFPTVEEMYPLNEVESEVFNFDQLEKVMEGKHRPGHFNGVARVVSKLFKIVNPDTAYFGEKDFQQLAVIRKLVSEMKSSINIIGCPTVREPDGLAMSSRNMLLNEEERKEASVISQTLFFVRDNWKKFGPETIIQKAIETIEASGMMHVEYFEIADEETLQQLAEGFLSKHGRCFTAVRLGKVRLIDNVSLYS